MGTKTQLRATTSQAQVPENSGQERFVPVNRGHFDLEPPGRAQAFSEKLGQGWDDEYQDYRRLWNENPAAQVVRDYPLLVDLEMSSRCNLECPMCPTVTEEFVDKRVKPFKRGSMDFKLVRKIIDEIAGKVYALRLSWVGEPTLNPRFIDAIRYAKEKGIGEVSFLTNGTKLRLEYFKQIADAGADWITVSIDGMGETYNKIRAPLKFEETLQKIRDIHAYKKAHGLSKPVMKIQGVWPAVRENPQAFYDTFAPLVDLVAFNPLIDYLHKDTDIVYEEKFCCPQLYQRLVISSSGNAALCSNDDMVDVVLGNAFEQSVHEIWHGEKMNSIRALHAQPDGFKKVSPCVRCYYPRKMQPGETAVINNRVIRIENYVNRKQTIGQ